jgi:Protein of unknown function (DUF4011)/REase_MTES_1575/AAA domain
MAAPSSVDVALARWRDRLLDLSARNPLINYKLTRENGLAVAHPTAAKVYQRLVQAKQPWSFWTPPQEEDATWDLGKYQPKGHELVCGSLGRRRLGQTLAPLFRRARQETQEHGLSLLHLACGFLDWRDADNQEAFRSPLLLVPVTLSRKSTQEPFMLGPGDEVPFVNPALLRRLEEDFKLVLPPGPATGDEAALIAFHKAVEAAIGKFPTWKFDNTLWLGIFPYFTGTLADDIDKAAAHPLVRVLAGDSDKKLHDELMPGPVADAHELDVAHNLEASFQVLDADGGQTVCLEAARAGHSFVIHGPPGTGKTQTIVNLIADGLAQGKRVLCVSGKAAALDAVSQRLGQIGLENYCLELLDSKARPSAVLAELARCLQQRPKSNAAPGPDLAKLKKTREQLAGYVHALHLLREPLQRSAWSVLAELAPLASVPTLPLGMPLEKGEEPVTQTPAPPSRNSVAAPPTARANITAVSEITPHWLDEARHAMQRLQQLWHIRTQKDFPWWGFKAERYNQQLKEEVLAAIDKIRTRLDKLQEVAKQYAGQIGATGPIAWLLKVGETLEALPGKVPTHWLVEKDLNQLAQDLEKCSDQYHRLGQARAPLTDRYGAGLWQLTEGTAAQVDRVWHAVAPLLARGDERGAGLITHQQLLRGWAADTQKRIPGWITEARTLEKWLAVPLPVGAGAAAVQPGEAKMDASPHTLRQLLRLANLCQSENPPERSWVHNPQALEDARQLSAANKPAFTAYHERRKKLLETYHEGLFELELDRMAAGYAGPYQSWTRFFSGQFRRDRRALKRRSRAYEYPATAGQDVTEARDLLVEKSRLESEAPQRQPVLGRYERGLDTDCEAAERATRVASEAVEIVHQLGCSILPPRFIDALCAGTAPPEKIRAAAKRLHDSLGAWLHATHELKAQLPMQDFPGSGRPLEETALSVLNHYAHDLQSGLNQFGSLTDTLLAKAPARPADAVTLVADLKQAEEVRAFEATHEDEAVRWSQRIGTGFQGLATNWEALRKCFAWIRKIRELFKETSSSPSAAGVPEQIVHLAAAGTAAPMARDLRHAQEQYEQALHGLENRFASPGLLLDGKRLSENPPEMAKQRLAHLRERVADLVDWIDWRQLPSRFEHLGLSGFLESLQKNPAPPEQLLPMFNKSFLTSWLDAVGKQEPTLASFQRQTHERLIADFAEMDRQWLQANRQRVEEKRPRPDAAGAEIAFIKEAERKPFAGDWKQLVQKLGAVLWQLKPCVLTSPLCVSQFLPADTPFDVVIVDEANQLAVEEAVPALRRGRQVIILGDDQQPGPSDDGTSLFAACKNAGLHELMLRTHYRSRHEGLFAFVNQHAYSNGIDTFPAVRTKNVGVSLTFVSDGTYDPPLGQNTREARVVADLVIEHLRSQPGKSLGVLACSTAQAQLIADEIDRRLVKQPELEKLLSGDRRDGFFVKSWESAAGDDRDVILWSTGYGPDSQRKLPADLGPLVQEDAAGLVNAAMSSAREKLTVVSSLRPADLEQKSPPRGVQLLRSVLELAEKPPASAVPSEVDPLAQDVLQELQQRGFSAVARVGLSAHRVDIGVVDPSAAGQYMLGIMFDGPGYHDAATVRERDRLRPEILHGLGWNLHRIWTLDWILRRKEEIDRLVRALDEATRPRSIKPSSPSQPAPAPRPVKAGKRK